MGGSTLPLRVFIRKKQNKSGSTSIHIVRKEGRKQILVKAIGSSSDASEIRSLIELGRSHIASIKKQSELSLGYHEDDLYLLQMLQDIDHIEVCGTELILGKLFDEVGFNAIKEPLFRHLVLSRICYPGSKLKVVEYLLRHYQQCYEIDAVYRYLDKLNNCYKEQIKDISYYHTVSILGAKMNIVFYDVTTLYFEASDEDDFRKTGFSKDGKAQHPQIVLGLLVSEYGYPLAYEMFEGNTFEGKTMLPVLEKFKHRYNLENILVIADAGLLSNENIQQLRALNYQFILGARIKNESHAMQLKINSETWVKNTTHIYDKQADLKLIVNYSESRASKDKHNRERGLKRLEKLIKSGKLTKQQINNRGYNKYLKLAGEVQIQIDYEKFNVDNKWDGLKGYITNADLSANEVMDHYKQLWHIEKAFRISKTDLRIRPIYHRVKRRTESHLMIAFCSYKIYKELERQLALKKSSISTAKAIAIMQSIYSIQTTLPIAKKKTKIIWAKTNEQKQLLSDFNIKI